jgi:ADP-ribosylglycohydrolase
MLLFTAEGLILSKVRTEYRQPGGIPLALYHGYLRWLATQDTHQQDRLIKTHGTCAVADGILTAQPALYARRAPGNTCLAALQSGRMGTIDQPINSSKGCGGVMRVAPVGLAVQDAEKAFRVGCESAAITHGHPTGYLAAGFLAALIARILAGDSLRQAVDASMGILETWPGHAECLRMVAQAVDLAERAEPSVATVEQIGAGWVAEEALAIGVYSALAGDEAFEKGVLLAVNHSGDSDSTGAITGNIMGALHGIGSVPQRWTAELELRDVIVEMANDLFDQVVKKMIVARMSRLT